MKKFLKQLWLFMLAIVFISTVFSAWRSTNRSTYEMIANRFLFTSWGTASGAYVLDTNSGGTIVAYGPLVDGSGNNFITWVVISWTRNSIPLFNWTGGLSSSNMSLSGTYLNLSANGTFSYDSTADYPTILWGNGNSIGYNCDSSIIAGGENNSIALASHSSQYSTIVWWKNNTIVNSIAYSTIIGSIGNTISANYSTVIGWHTNNIGATYSYALGKNVTIPAGSDYSFVYSNTGSFTNNTGGRFVVNAYNGTYIYNGLYDGAGNAYITGGSVSGTYLLVSQSGDYFEANSWAYFEANSWAYFNLYSWDYYTSNPLGYVTGGTLSWYVPYVWATTSVNLWVHGIYNSAYPVHTWYWAQLYAKTNWSSQWVWVAWLAYVNATTDTADAIWLLWYSTAWHISGNNIWVWSRAEWGINNYSFYWYNWDIYNDDNLYISGNAVITGTLQDWLWNVYVTGGFVTSQWYISALTGTDGQLCAWSGGSVECNVSPTSGLVETDPIWMAASGDYLLTANSGDYFEANSWTYYTTNPLNYITGWAVLWNVTDGSTGGFAIFTGDGTLTPAANIEVATNTTFQVSNYIENGVAGRFYDFYNGGGTGYSVAIGWYTYRGNALDAAKVWHLMTGDESDAILEVRSLQLAALSGGYEDSSPYIKVDSPTWGVGDLIQLLKNSVKYFWVDYLGDTHIAGALHPSRIVKRVSVTETGTGVTPDGDYDIYQFTGLDSWLTIANSSVSIYDGEQFKLRITDDGSAQSITWGTGYSTGWGIALPTLTTTGKLMTLGLEYYENLGKWVLLAFSTEW